MDELEDYCLMDVQMTMRTIFGGKLKPMQLTSVTDNDSPQPYAVDLKYSVMETRREMFEWCSERFGRHTKQWDNPRWSVNAGMYIFRFKKPKDRTMFLLRWS